jgi:16S rRNA (adenine1518-N6/adenine1519-N6)-dimethyltransferase
VQLIQGDILALDVGQIIGATPYLVVANIPYYITSALIRHLLEGGRQPTRLVLTVQREVAERICALPGELSLLALSVQLYGQPHIRARIPAGAFYPTPKVDSAVVRVDLYPQPLIQTPLVESFFRLAKAGFSQKRKTLGNALAASLAWPKDKAEAILLAAGIDPRRRAQTLSLGEWEALTRQYTGEKRL